MDDEKAIEMGFDPLEDEALRITGKNREDLAKAPLPKTVWKKFCDFVNQYNWKGTQFFAPIPAGFNIIGFDMIIVDRLCKAYGPYDKERQQQKLFNKIYKVDMMDYDDPFYVTIENLFQLNYTQEQRNLINWWLYDKFLPTGEVLILTHKDTEEIIHSDTPADIWDLIQEQNEKKNNK